MNDLYVTGAACPSGKLSSKNSCCSRVGRLAVIRKPSLTVSDERLVMNALVSFAPRFLHSALAGTLPPVEKTRRTLFAKKSLGSYVLYLATIKILFCVCLAHARQQGLGTPVATGVALTDSIAPLKIGDTIPEILWKMPLQLIKAGRQENLANTLHDYRGKLIILDFWATWCGSCIEGMPHASELQHDFSDNVSILNISQEKELTIKNFLNRRSDISALNLQLIADKTMAAYFPHRLIPHLVWIGPHGDVIAFTGKDKLTSATIKSALDGHTDTWDIKKDNLKWSEHEPILLNSKNTQSVNILARSILTEEDKSLPVRQHLVRDNQHNNLRLYALNQPIKSLYNVAYRMPAIYHPSLMEFTLRTHNKHKGLQQAHCYEVELPGNDTAAIYSKMQADLDQYFHLSSTMVSTQRMCWVLKKKDIVQLQLETKGAKPFQNLTASTKNKSILQNQYIYFLASHLAKIYSDKPLINEVDYHQRMDMELTSDLDNAYELNKSLAKYGLQLAQEVRELKILRITASQ